MIVNSSLKVSESESEVLLVIGHDSLLINVVQLLLIIKSVQHGYIHSDTNLSEMEIKYSFLLREKSYVCVFASFSNLAQST